MKLKSGSAALALLIGGVGISAAQGAVIACKDAAAMARTTCSLGKRPAPASTRAGHPILTQQALLKRFSASSAGFPTSLAARLYNPLIYSLAITNVAKNDVNELTPVQTSFTLKITRLRPDNSSVTIPDISICSEFVEANLPCYQIHNPQLGQTYSGTVQASAPWAGMSAPLRIVALESRLLAELNSWLVVADATRPMSTAATYNLSFDGFTLKDTRSNSTDTVWLNIQGQVQSNPSSLSASTDACKLVGFKWCIMGYKYGDAHNSGYRAVAGQSIGSFRLTPEKEDSLKFLYYVYNYGTGHLQEIGDGVANGFSKAGEAILGAYGAIEGSSSMVQYSQELDGIMESFHSSATASCDGPLVLDVAVFMNKSVDQSNANTLDAFTRGTGQFSVTPATDYRYKDGDFVCDRRGSDYTVAFSVHRTSWRDWHPYPAA